MGQQDRRGDVEPVLRLDVAVDVASTVDHDEAVQSGPSIMNAPFHLTDDDGGPGFEPTAIATSDRVPADDRVLEIPGFLFRGEETDIVVQGALVFLESEDVIGLHADDGPGDAALASPGIRQDAERFRTATASVNDPPSLLPIAARPSRISGDRQMQTWRPVSRTRSLDALHRQSFVLATLTVSL